MPESILKISVLLDGSLLLDGRPIAFADLSRAIESAGAGTTVWYYREQGESDPPPVAMEVIKCIAARKLPVRLCSKPDFSETVAPGGIAGVNKIFDALRQRAAQGQLAILRPDGRAMMLPALSREAAPADAVATVERLLPSTVKRNVAVIADTSWTMSQKPAITDAARAIPFFGMLMGLAAIGHALWIFDGANAALIASGCAEADLLIVDGARAEALPSNWKDLAASAMRSRQIFLHDHTTSHLRRV
jgi:hypothetical protein